MAAESTAVALPPTAPSGPDAEPVAPWICRICREPMSFYGDQKIGRHEGCAEAEAVAR